jgi:hypothetical protein
VVHYTNTAGPLAITSSARKFTQLAAPLARPIPSFQSWCRDQPACSPRIALQPGEKRISADTSEINGEYRPAALARKANRMWFGDIVESGPQDDQTAPLPIGCH